MVAITTAEQELSLARGSSPKSPTKRRKDKMTKSPSPSQRYLVQMLEEECENSFRKSPDEEPIHIWNTHAVEAHNERMKKLDRKLANCNDEVVKLKEMLRLSDEKRDTEIARFQQGEEDARQEIADFQETCNSVEKDSMSTEVQYGQLKAKLETNLVKIKALRNEGKALNKELRKAEKQKDKFALNNTKLEESSTSLLSSCSSLCDSQIFEENDILHNIVEEEIDTFEKYKHAVGVIQERYLNEAQQRLDLQKTMAGMLSNIQGSTTVPAKLASACMDIGLSCEARSNQLMAELEQSEELNG